MNIISVPSQRYQDSRHLLQNPKVARSVMGFSNRTQRFTGSIYLDVDSPFGIWLYTKYVICVMGVLDPPHTLIIMFNDKECGDCMATLKYDLGRVLTLSAT